ncbi:hypothetical protein AM587_10003150 [Phytophthora nicotianae]|uniref:Uncharacterized protein n=1 Tax=Phytophthora nicotianae TaxID=4792 RepID=A0A0W8DLI6_PHYNI|nr:hypothetical protein AM587_10003150 [Phytophthora nicotianae]KUF97036.1 hypothetical protein AM588_10006543 [Phytophthora nicotianae]
MKDSLVAQLKAELKRTLRKHVGEAVNDVCNAFVDELDPPPPAPMFAKVGALKNEVDYDCCRQLVEYIVLNMDTSPDFAQQMDCVILAYQSNASMDILNSVVTQNMWVRRKLVPLSGGERDTLNKPNAFTEVQTQLKDKSQRADINPEERNVSLESTKFSRTDSIKVNHAEASAKSCEGANTENSQRKELDRTNCGDVVKNTKFITAKTSTFRSEILPTKATINLSKRAHSTAKYPSADVMIASSSSDSLAESDSDTFVATASNSTHTTVQANSAEASISDTSASVDSQTNNNVASRPREWGKRKRLVTRKRPKEAGISSKRARQAPWTESPESSDQSFTGHDTFLVKRASARQDASDVSIDNNVHTYLYKGRGKVNVVTAEVKRVAMDQQKISVKGHGSEVIPPTSKLVVVEKQPLGDTLQTNRCNSVIKTGTMGTTGVEAFSQTEHLNVHEKKKNSNVPSRLSRYFTMDDEVVVVEKEKKSQNLKAFKATKDIETKSGHNSEESSIDFELRQVERDLEAGDEVWRLNVAKAKFQAILDVLVSSLTQEAQSTVLSNAETGESAQAEDPIANLCNPTQRSADQTRLFKRRLRDTMAIIDAMLCNPPRGQACSRNCKDIRAQLCNEFTPCINPTCRAWHEAEAHIETCPSEQCELKNRVRLRETLHLIERKQQQANAAHAALEHANAALLSPTRHSNKERNNVGNEETFAQIENLEQDLANLKGELMILVDMKLQLSITLSDIGIDANSDDGDRFPDFASHYTTRSHRRKSP